jgi:hypothetical protein
MEGETPLGEHANIPRPNRMAMLVGATGCARREADMAVVRCVPGRGVCATHVRRKSKCGSDKSMMRVREFPHGGHTSDQLASETASTARERVTTPLTRHHQSQFSLRRGPRSS